jgi:hypothetical protein
MKLPPNSASRLPGSSANQSEQVHGKSEERYRSTWKVYIQDRSNDPITDILSRMKACNSMIKIYFLVPQTLVGASYNTWEY